MRRKLELVAAACLFLVAVFFIVWCLPQVLK